MRLMAKGWRKGACKGPKDGVKYWRVCSEFGENIWVCECECGKNEDYSSHLDWRYGNFFETKEKAEQAAVDWIKEIVNQMVVEGEFALKLRCLTEEELKLWENVRDINPVLSVE